MKNELRKKIIKLRNSLDSDYIKKASVCISDKLLEIPEIIKAENIMVYMDFRNEVKTDYLIEKLMSMGKNVFAPVCVHETREMIPRKVDSKTVFINSRFGVLEPSEDSEAVSPDTIDVIIVPGVAFDRAGNRMGYGGGYYDRFIPKTNAFTCGVRFECQIVNDVFEEEHDVRIDVVVTESNILF